MSEHSLACDCGVEVTAASLDEHVAAVTAHFAGTHPDLGLTETQLRNFLERRPHLTGPTERIDEIGTVEIVPVDATRVDDVLAFFDHDAFVGQPGWASCYCMAHHVSGGDTGEAWGRRTWQENRAELAERIRSGRTTGSVAYADGRVVAWCNASARSEFPEATIGDGDGDVGFVACFAIAPSHRGHGLARRLLEGSCDALAAAGKEAVEARPVTDPESAASAYRGPLDLYLGSGFHQVGDGSEVTVRRLLR